MRKPYLAAVGLVLLGAPAIAEDACGLCDTEVVINAPLAQCFLEQFAALEKRDGAAVAVDLSNCTPPQVTERGVVDALPSAQAAVPVQPTMEFMLSRAQLGCLKEKLQQPGLVLDPAATIKLDACNGQASGAN